VRVAGTVEHVLTAIPAWAVYLSVFLLPFGEAAIMLGFVIPGETALIFGGVLAGRNQVSLSVVLILAVAGAVIGDAIGYAIGRRWGPSLQVSRLGQVVGTARWRVAEDFVHRRGAPAVFFGRYTALLRALVPGMAGMARLPYGKFALWNVLGGGTWAGICVLGGYAVGDVVGEYLSDFSKAVVIVVVLTAGAFLVYRHRRTEAS
jgi:membrane-associated protein